MGNAWQWYASVNDDIRHHVIERGWHGQYRDDRVMSQDTAEMAAQQTPEPSAEYAAVYGRDPHVPEALEGIGARGVDDPNGESIKAAVHEYYEMDAGQGALEAPDHGDIHDVGMELEQ